MPASVQLRGYDIDLSQCPPRPWLPDNVEMQQWNMFEDVPETMIGRFDLVHIRLVGVVIQDNNASPVIKNLVKMLSRMP